MSELGRKSVGRVDIVIVNADPNTTPVLARAGSVIYYCDPNTGECRQYFKNDSGETSNVKETTAYQSLDLTLNTTDATWTEFHRVTLEEGDIKNFEVDINAAQSNGSEITSSEIKSTCARRAGEGVSSQGDTTQYQHGFRRYRYRSREDGNDIVFEVRGWASHDVNWTIKFGERL